MATPPETKDSLPTPLKVITFKDGDEEKVVQCFSEEQIREVEGYLELRVQFELECKDELVAIQAEWDAKKEKLASEYKALYDAANEKKERKEKEECIELPLPDK